MLQVEIRIQGCLDEHWSDWFDGFTIQKISPGETLITGSVPDQSALYGVIAKARDLGLFLVAVNIVQGPDHKEMIPL